MKTSPLTAITETVGDAVSSGSGIVHDLAPSAVKRASELASTAAGRVPELPDAVSHLAGRAQRRLRPAKTRSPWWPVLAFAAAVGICLAIVVWWVRRAPAAADDRASAAPVGDRTERDVAAAGD